MRRLTGVVGWLIAGAVIWTTTQLVVQLGLDAVGVDAVSTGDTGGDERNTPGQFLALGVGLAVAVAAVVLLRRWQATPSGGSQRRRRLGLVAAGLVAVFAVGAVLRPQLDTVEDDADRERAIDEMTDRGMTADEAACVADALSERFDTNDLEAIGNDEPREVIRVMLGCSGVAAGASDCFIDGFADIADVEGGSLDVVAAEEALDADGREALAQLGLRCGGTSEDVAACVTAAMRRELGDGLFERRRLDLSAAEQDLVGTLTTTCSAAPTGDAAAVAPDECSTYARAIAETWAEHAPGPADQTPKVLARAVAATLDATTGAAPAALRDDAAALAEVARDHAEDRMASHDEDDTSEDAAAALFELAAVTLDTQVRIWRGCPDLDAGLGGDPLSIGGLVFAIGGSQADMDDDLRRCIDELDATTVGDSVGCDALADACEAGVHEACDDIYVWSAIGSDHEEIGASCGGRVTRRDELYAQGSCDLLAE